MQLGNLFEDMPIVQNMCSLHRLLPRDRSVQAAVVAVGVAISMKAMRKAYSTADWSALPQVIHRHVTSLSSYELGPGYGQILEISVISAGFSQFHVRPAKKMPFNPAAKAKYSVKNDFPATE